MMVFCITLFWYEWFHGNTIILPNNTLSLVYVVTNKQWISTQYISLIATDNGTSYVYGSVSQVNTHNYINVY